MLKPQYDAVPRVRYYLRSRLRTWSPLTRAAAAVVLRAMRGGRLDNVAVARRRGGNGAPGHDKPAGGG